MNLNLLLRGIEDPVVLLFQTGCGMIVTTAYPYTSFKVPYLPVIILKQNQPMSPKRRP